MVPHLLQGVSVVFVGLVVLLALGRDLPEYRVAVDQRQFLLRLLLRSNLIKRGKCENSYQVITTFKLVYLDPLFSRVEVFLIKLQKTKEY